MNSIKHLTQPQVSVFGHSAELSSGVIQTEDDKLFIHTFKFVKLFPIKIYLNYFRKKIYAHQCNCLSKQFNKNITERVIVITDLFDENTKET
jgi:hypothetical protein